jgi:hypothetical protein
MPDLLHGRFVWYELMVDDTKAAEAFYTRVVGWNARPFPGGGHYTVWHAGEKGIGGMMPLTPEAKASGACPAWTIYVAVRNADESVARLLALGGKVFVPAMTVPGVGRFAIVADPQGAVFALIQPDGPEPTAPDVPAAPLEISWRELATSDLAGATSFYTELFGWDRLHANDMGPLGTYQEFGRFGLPLGGMYRKPAEMPFPPHWLIYAKVPDLDAALKAVSAEGGKVLNGPMEIPGGDRIAQCHDPQGAAFALHQAKA